MRDRHILLAFAVALHLVAGCAGAENPTDASVDALVDSASDAADSATRPTPGSGAVGSDCERDSDCSAGACIDVGDGEMRCAGSCEGGCPAGWACGEYGMGEFVQQVCLCASEPESCNESDDDCDGVVDEGVAGCCEPDSTRECGEGFCTPGMQRCLEDRRWSACEGGTPPEAEVCDGVDNDCNPETPDGAEDEGDPCDLDVCGLESGCEGVLRCDDGVPECDPDRGRFETVRTAELSPALEVREADVKVVLIIDNSESMAEEQDRMATGIARMLDSLRSIPHLGVEFFLYSTDGVAFTSRDKPTVDDISYTIWEDGTRHEDAARPPSFSQPYTLYQEHPLLPPYNGGGRLLFASSATDAEFMDLRDRLTSAVRAMGIAGSTQEAGLCSMGQVILGYGDNAILDEGDTAAFILLTDADEWSGSRIFCNRNAVREYTPEVIESTTSTRDPTLAFRAEYLVWGVGYSFRYPGVNPETGEITPGSRSRSGAIDPARYGLANTCEGPTRACPAALIADIRADHDLPAPDSCEIRCSPIWNSGPMLREDYPPEVDLCTNAYERDGTTYDDAFDEAGEATAATPERVPADQCSVRLTRRITTTIWDDVNDIVRTPVELPPEEEMSGAHIPALTAALPAMFGEEGYFVSAVINHPDLEDPECSATSEGVGEQFNRFVDGLGERGVKQSICDTDYTESLAGLESFIEENVQRTFELELEPGEVLDGVVIVRADGSMEDVPVEAISLEGSRLTISGDVEIMEGDRIVLRIVRL